MNALRIHTLPSFARQAGTWIAQVLMFGGIALFGNSTVAQSDTAKDAVSMEGSISDEMAQGIYVEDDVDQWCYPPVCEP